MRTTIAAALMMTFLAACGASEQGDDDIPGVNATGTADTELFTNDPDTVGVPTAAQGGTSIDSVPPGTPGTAVQSESDIGQQP